jgi:predicted helicase
VSLGDKGDKGIATIFEMYSCGVKTNRDSWVYNFSREELEANMCRMIDNYNKQVALHSDRCKVAGNNAIKMAMDLADSNPRNIKWTLELYKDLARGKTYDFEPDGIRVAKYRPFCKQWMYFNRQLNNSVYQMPKLFPSTRHLNLAISVTGTGSSKDFSCLIVDTLPDLEVISKGQCFPLYFYEKAAENNAGNGELFSENEATADADGYVRHEAITDTALENFRQHYGDATISKEDIFYYVYGVLHSPEYRSRYAADLKKMLPRVPYAPDFWAFSKAGRDLAYWHLNYETVEPWPVEEDAKPKGDLDNFSYYRVEKMRFAGAGGREKDKSTIIYNSRITLRGIPLEAYEYVVNGKSAIEWVMERYQVSVDSDSGIRNDPNDWCREHNDPVYILNLLKRVIRVSIETVRIVKGLPSIQ